MPDKTAANVTQENTGTRFLETVVALKNGAVLQEVGDRMNALIAAVRETARGGSLTLQIKVAPATSGTAEVVTVEATIKEAFPRPSLGKTVFFTTEQNLLVRNDPRQMALRMDPQQKEQ